MTWHLDDYNCTLLRGILRRSFQETLPRNTAENTAKHRGGGVGSVVANHRGGGESSVTITTTLICSLDLHRPLDSAARSHGVSQPPALQCHASAGCQSRHLAN